MGLSCIRDYAEMAEFERERERRKSVQETNITQPEFDEILFDIVSKIPSTNLIGIPGVYEEVAEHFNNEVLEEFGARIFDSWERKYEQGGGGCE